MNQWSDWYPSETRNVLYFKTGSNAGNLELSLNTGDSRAQTFSVSDWKWEKLTPEDFSANLYVRPSAGAFPAFWEVRDWKPEFGAYPLIVAAEESSPDGMVLRWSGHALRSGALPVQPGKKCKLDFWLKSDKDTTVQFSIDGYFGPHQGKHCFLQRSFMATSEFRQCTLEWEVPGDLAAAPDLKSGVFLCREANGKWCFSRGRRRKELRRSCW